MPGEPVCLRERRAGESVVDSGYMGNGRVGGVARLMRGLSLALSPVNRHVCLSPHRTSEKHTNTDVSLANARVHYIYDTNLSSTAVPQMHCENALPPLEGASAQQ